MIADFARLVENLPTAARLVATAKRAANGDRAALETLTTGGGWVDALELVSPGSGQKARIVLDQLRNTAHQVQQTLDGNVIDGEYQVVDGRPREPWGPFMRWLFRQTYGGHIIMGTMGSGKTSLAKKLAWRWAQEHGYQIECVSMYGHDVPQGAVTIGAGTLVRRMVMLRKYLDSLAVLDDGEDLIMDDRYKDVPAQIPPQRRVIVMDEASLSISVSPLDPVRWAALAAIANCRHVQWLVVFIGQQASQIPPGLFGQTTKWVKRPSGDEQYADRQNPLVQELWRQAQEHFAGLESLPWYQPPLNTPKAWAYVSAPPSDWGDGYRGLVPFTPIDVNREDLG